MIVMITYSIIYKANTTGMAIMVLHGFPLSSPGFHSGIMRITR